MVDETDRRFGGTTDDRSGLSRRRAFGLSAAGVAAIWVAPQIISVPAAAAATAFRATMVAVGAGGTVIRTSVPSPQGPGDWFDHGSITTARLQGVASNEQVDSLRWVAVGEGGEIHTSSGTAADWVPDVSGTALDLTCIAWTGAGFVAAGAQGIILASPDGVTWSTVRAADGLASLRGVASDDTQVIAVGDGGRIFRAPLNDLGDWTAEASPTTPGTLDLFAVAATSASFVAVGAPAVLTSEFTIIVREAATWTPRSSDAPASAQRLDAVAIDPVTELAVAAGAQRHARNDAPSAYSPAWEIATDVGLTFLGMTARATTPRFVYVGTGGQIHQDDDGLAVTSVPSPTTQDLFAVAHD